MVVMHVDISMVLIAFITQFHYAAICKCNMQVTFLHGLQTFQDNIFIKFHVELPIKIKFIFSHLKYHVAVGHRQIFCDKVFF